ncbi:MAG: hypothetical protein WA633_19810 [Stellaceae bacterium]|jgi:hypothetical protein
MSDADKPTPELYREAAERVRRLADGALLPDIRDDLLEVAARFERMAAYFDAANSIQVPPPTPTVFGTGTAI